jgi:hypothetical protein
MGNQSGEARIAVKRIEHGVCFNPQVNSGRQPVVNSLEQKRERHLGLTTLCEKAS